jgi:hypothetical protein
MDFHPKPPSNVWILGSLEFLGFGSKRVGGLFAAYGGEVQGWLTPELGIGGRISAYAAGEPDGGSSHGLMAAADVIVRTRVIERTHQSIWLWASLGGGSIGMTGYTSHSNTGDHFDERSGFVNARAGVMGEYGPLAYGAALDVVIVPAKGTAVSPMYFAGFAF